MRDKIVKTNKTYFDFVARRLGIIGIVLIVMTLALGLPLVNNLNKENSTLIDNIGKHEKNVSNLQLQLEDGSVTID